MNLLVTVTYADHSVEFLRWVIDDSAKDVGYISINFLPSARTQRRGIIVVSKIDVGFCSDESEVLVVSELTEKGRVNTDTAIGIYNGVKKYIEDMSMEVQSDE